VKAFLDTHAAVFMARGSRDAFGGGALDLIDRAAIFYSPFVALEMRFLREIGRITMEVPSLIDALERSYGVLQSDERTADVAAVAAGLTWTRDPFDRLIVATATLHKAPLISKDEHIATHYPDTVW